MSAGGRGLPTFVAEILQWLLVGRAGAEVLEELERESARLRGSRGNAIAALWGFAQLLRPQTWVLAVELRGSAFDDTGKRDPALGASRTGFGVSMLDVKLGVRMLGKHPAVTFVIVFALGIGIPASLAPHILIDAVFDTPLPLDDGGRIKALVLWNPATGAQALPRIDEYELWRDQLTTIASLGAASPRSINLILEDGRAAPVRGAMMTASSFGMTRVPPLLGRTLSQSDELAGSPEVAVIGYDLWRSRFGGDSDVIGKTVSVAGTATTVVGVMPEGYAFPGSEQLWLPLRARAADYAPGAGPPLWVYGRLADRSSRKNAQAELEVVTRRALVGDAADVEEATMRRPQVARFSALSFGTPRGRMWLLVSFVQTFPIFLLLIACGNVAVLLLARTANRTGEFAIRTALGAGRWRVISQLFTETLVLATLATGFGLLLLHLLLSRLDPVLGGPFWLRFGVTPEIVLKAFALAVFSAVVAGVFPAWKATGRHVQDTLQRSGATGGGVRFGRLADALIIVEVALGVGALFGGVMSYRMFAPASNEQLQAVEANRFLVASVAMPLLGVPGDLTEDDRLRQRERIAAGHRELRRRLSAEPGVRAVTIADAPPGGENKERRGRFTDDDLPPDFGGYPIVVTYVDEQFFRTLDVTPLRGRLFEASDVPLEPGTLASHVILNSKFVERSGGADPVGRVLRLELDRGPATSESPVFQVIGVVPDVEANRADNVFDGTPVAYLPAVPGAIEPMTIVVDVGEAPESFAPRLRRIVADTDPAAMVQSVGALDEPGAGARVGGWALMILGGLAGIAIVLSSAALYALMSFTVARRTREIGIRTALGGSAPSIVTTVARRALLQLGAGVGLGSAFWVLVLRVGTGGWGTASGGSGDLEVATANWPLVLVATVGAVAAVALAACVAPTLRGIRIRPVEALRSE